MKKNGFITSALLYGILALFLILMLGSLSVLANRKMSMDALKEAALEDVGSTSGISGYYNIWRTDVSYEYAGYATDAGYSGTWQTVSTRPSLVFSTGSYQNIGGVYLNLQEATTYDIEVTVYYSNTTTFSTYQKVSGTLFSGSNSISLTFSIGNYKYIKLEIGNMSGLTYKINEISLIVQNTTN